MPVKSVQSMGWTRRNASVSVLLAMDDYREQAGRRLRELREQRGLSQEELAGAAKLSVKTISRFENGRHDGRRGTLRQLAEALGVSEDVITGPPPAPLGLGVDPEADQMDKIVRHLEAIDARLGSLEDRLEEVIGQRTKQNTDIIQRLADLEHALNARTDALLPGIQELLAAAEESRHEEPAQTAHTAK